METPNVYHQRNYRNLYQSPKSDQLTAESYLRVYEGNSEMVPGFTMSMRTRPLCINKFREFVFMGILAEKARHFDK